MKVKKISKIKDFLQIKNCKICKGNPKTTSEFIALPFKGIKCEDCYKVISFEKSKQ